MSKVVQLKAHKHAARAARVRALLKDREKAEAEIAALLREELDDLGEAKWLVWCEREFGWARRQSYAHLNPEQMEKHRERQRRRAQAAHIAPTRGHESESTEETADDMDEVDPANYRTAFFIRTDQAERFTADCEYLARKLPISKDMAAATARVAAAWAKLAKTLEKSL